MQNIEVSKKIILLSASFLICLNVIAWQEVFALNQQQYLKVIFLDVGQGDSAFIETPQKHQILIDGGPGSTVLEKLSQFMPVWDKTIDLVILTHPEKDHMQGLLGVLKKYKADYILWTGTEKNAAEYKEWVDVLGKQEEAGSKIIIADSHKKIIAGGLEIETIFPLENLQGVDIVQSTNEDSVVNKIIYGEVSFLFTGDISSKTEKEIVYSGENIKSDILKVAHHGSKYSTSDLFLASIKPGVAIIEVGKNSYGHPTSEVLNRLENFGIKVFITQRDGDVEFISDGKTIKINNSL